MATVIYDAHASTNLTSGDAYAGGVAPSPGDTVDISVDTAPTVGLGAGMFHFQLTASLTVGLDAFLGAGAIGNVTVNAAAAHITCATPIAGNLVVTQGSVSLDRVTVTGATTVAGSLLDWLGLGASVFNGAVALSGGHIGEGMWDFNLRLSGSGTIGSGGLVVITGTVNLTACPWNLMVGSSLTVDNAGPLTMDLGAASAPNLALSVNLPYGAITLDADVSVYSLDGVAGDFAEGGRTISILRADGGQGLSWTACTNGQNINVTIPAGANIEGYWTGISGAANALGILTINGVLSTAEMGFHALAGSGTCNMGADYLHVYPIANNFWTFTGTVTGGVEIPPTVIIYMDTSLSNALPITPPANTLVYLVGTVADRTLTLNGGLTCGTLQLYGNNLGLTVGGGNLQASGVLLGAAANAGRLTLGVSAHSIGAGGIAADVDATGELTLQAGARLNLGGNMTLARITANLGTAAILPTATCVIDGDGATSVVGTLAVIHANGQALTVQNVHATGTVVCFGATYTSNEGVEEYAGGYRNLPLAA